MKIYQFLFSKSIDKILLLLCVYCFALISFRVFYTEKVTFVFLVWNLFLAGIPYLLSKFLGMFNQKYMLFGFLIPVVLFLPNSAYIITDLFHIRWASRSLVWYDTILILTYSITGLIFFYATTMNIKKAVFPFFGKRSELMVLVLFFLNGFGIYLGRYLRFNSWDVVSNPSQLIQDVFYLVLFPSDNKLAWGVTLLYGMTFFMGYLIVRIVGSQKMEFK